MERARAKSILSASRSESEVRRAMTRVQPSRVVTLTPVKNTATRPPFAGNVFLNGGEELLAAASQPTARYPRREPGTANQRASRSCGPIGSDGRGGDCAAVAPTSGDLKSYQYAEPERPLQLPEGRRAGGGEVRYSYRPPEQPLDMPEVRARPLRFRGWLRALRWHSDASAVAWNRMSWMPTRFPLEHGSPRHCCYCSLFGYLRLFAYSASLQIGFSIHLACLLRHLPVLHGGITAFTLVCIC